MSADFHPYVLGASKLFRVEPEAVSPDMRRDFKEAFLLTREGIDKGYFESEYEKLASGENVLIPVSVEHARAMLLIAEAYLKEYEPQG